MITITRVAITLISCVSLTIVGTASAASAHPRHVAPVSVVGHVHVPTHGMATGAKDWCC